MHFEINIFEFNFRICTTLMLQIFLSLLPKNPPLFLSAIFHFQFSIRPPLFSHRFFGRSSNSHPINYPQPRPTVELPRENTGLRQPVTFSDGMGWLVYTRTWSLECRRTLRIFYSNHESWSHFVRGKTKK